MLGTVLLIVLVLLLLGALPTWPHAAGWGPYAADGIGLVLVVVLILVLVGRISGSPPPFWGVSSLHFRAVEPHRVGGLFFV